MLTKTLVLGGIAFINFGDEVCVLLFGGRLGAWDYILQGFGLGSAFLALASFPLHWLFRLGFCWGAGEAFQRPICRVAFSLDRAPNISEGQTLCQAAYGTEASFISLFLALTVFAIAQEAFRGKG